MSENNVVTLPYDDYAQSANTLFHFMEESEFLEFILESRAIVPRYCKENIEDLNIHMGDTIIKEVAILQKCFCDIPVHKLMESFKWKGVGKEYESLEADEKSRCEKNNTHPDFYGKFGIAFSKSWCEKQKLQPVHYLNETSQYLLEISKLFDIALEKDDLLEEYVNDILNRLVFMKPLRGIMRKGFRFNEFKKVTSECFKNFHDEQEWRYVPSSAVLSEAKMECIIANPHMFSLRIDINKINERLVTEKYRPLWLEYNYNDIRYIIVPDKQSRNEIINKIMAISDEKFDSQESALMEKHILISKIMVLDEIRKDW